MAKNKSSASVTEGLFGTRTDNIQSSSIESDATPQESVKVEEIKSTKPVKRKGRPKAKDLGEDEKTFKATYYSTDEIERLLKIEAFKTDRSSSEIIRRLIRDHIKDDIEL